MQTTSKKNNILGCIFVFISTFIVSPVNAADILLSSPKGEHVAIYVKKQQVIAKDNGKNIIYEVAATVAQHLTRADDIRVVGSASNQKEQLFIVMLREPSRPNAMGRGYCGAGYEDYLLLVEILEKKLLLRDQLLLQSCLKSISMFIDQGDDHPSNGLAHEKDGFYSYRLVDDDVEKKRMLTVSNKHFKTKLVSTPDQ
ncbi:hypothetical protein QPK32_04470 [Massilia sp. YIM B02763]|uniref:hypothetical protein n=1 Tax=Massilia sp. YIM B02763 TaxID=3050130 RepID=UPI0025B68425|nr:hypothetical protein [Massilia sp. YIM B02763]MDN4052317.1 hypothetical protein [Massilia sp. YIM B02763]